MSDQSVIFSLFLIFTGAAVMASFMLWTRQAMIIGYILAGVIIGPWGLGWLADTRVITGLAEIGIVFLLFLLGLDLTPQKLLSMFRATTLATLLTSLLFLLAGWGIAIAFGFSQQESILTGIACMFSSTIISIKLLPTTVLHHRRTGELIISILLLQDLIAILVLIGLQSFGNESAATPTAWLLIQPLIALPALMLAAFALERRVLIKLFERYSRVQEYLFLLTIAWCLGLAYLAHAIGLSYEIGAFIAGVVLASSPIAQFIVTRLKPLRDFFLVLFFFAVGAVLNLDLLTAIIWPALTVAAVMLLLKPAAFALALKGTADSPANAWETGFRLGHMSEFSLLIAFLAMQIPGLSAEVILLIQVATVLTFIVSSSFVVLNYPTPVALDEKLRRD